MFSSLHSSMSADVELFFRSRLIQLRLFNSSPSMEFSSTEISCVCVCVFMPHWTNESEDGVYKRGLEK